MHQGAGLHGDTSRLIIGGIIESPQAQRDHEIGAVEFAVTGSADGLSLLILQRHRDRVAVGVFDHIAVGVKIRKCRQRMRENNIPVSEIAYGTEVRSQ